MAIGESGGQPDRPRAVRVSEVVHIDLIVRGGPVGCGKRRRVEAAAELRCIERQVLRRAHQAVSTLKRAR
jgi:hypothetical protein